MSKLFNLDTESKDNNSVLTDEYNVLTLEELTAIEKDLDANFDMLNTADRCMVSLESKRDQLEKMLTAEVNPETLKVSLEHVNFMYDMLGIKQIDLSTESFTTHSTEETTISIEGISDKLKTAGIAIKDTMVKIIKKIIVFFKKIWNYLFGKEKIVKKAEDADKKTPVIIKKAISDISSPVINNDELNASVIIDNIDVKDPTTNPLNLDPATTPEKVVKNVNARTKKFRENMIKIFPMYVIESKGNIVTSDISQLLNQSLENINSDIYLLLGIFKDAGDKGAISINRYRDGTNNNVQKTPLYIINIIHTMALDLNEQKLYYGVTEYNDKIKDEANKYIDNIVLPSETILLDNPSAKYSGLVDYSKRLIKLISKYNENIDERIKNNLNGNEKYNHKQNVATILKYLYNVPAYINYTLSAREAIMFGKFK